MNLGVDYWEYFSDFLGQCKGKISMIKNLALVSKKVHRGVRLGATPYLRWKANVNILDSEVAPFWVHKIRAMTIRMIGCELQYMRLARPDVLDLKIVIPDKTEKYFFAKNKTLSGIKKLHIYISDDNTSFDLHELPEGLEKFTIERLDPMNDVTDTYTHLPKTFPDSLRELTILSVIGGDDSDYGNYELPPYLIRLYYKSEFADFDLFKTYPDTIEDITIIRKSTHGYDYNIEEEMNFPNLKFLTLIDVKGVKECEINLDQFPKLQVVVVNGLKISDWSNRRIDSLDTVNLNDFPGLGDCTHDAVKVVLKPNKKSRKC